MDFTLFGTPGSSLKSTVTANLRYFLQKDARRSKGMSAPPGIITLKNSCQLFTFTTGGKQEFDRKFYEPWKICITIYLLKRNGPNLLAVCLEVDPSSPILLRSIQTTRKPLANRKQSKRIARIRGWHESFRRT